MNIIEELQTHGQIRKGRALLNMDKNGFHFRDAKNMTGKYRHDLHITSSAERVTAHWNGFVQNIEKGNV